MCFFSQVEKQKKSPEQDGLIHLTPGLSLNRLRRDSDYGVFNKPIVQETPAI